MLEIRRKTPGVDIPDISDLLPEIQSICITQSQNQNLGIFERDKDLDLRLNRLMKAVAKRYGLKAHKDFWNPAIDLLDRDYENWRGYPNPAVKGRAIAA